MADPIDTERRDDDPFERPVRALAPSRSGRPAPHGPEPVEPDAAAAHARPPRNPEEIQRIEVDEEDRLAFRVGVNLLTLALIGVGVWLLVRAYLGG